MDTTLLIPIRQRESSSTAFRHALSFWQDTSGKLMPLAPRTGVFRHFLRIATMQSLGYHQELAENRARGLPTVSPFPSRRQQHRIVSSRRLWTGSVPIYIYTTFFPTVPTNRKNHLPTTNPDTDQKPTRPRSKTFPSIRGWHTSALQA